MYLTLILLVANLLATAAHGQGLNTSREFHLHTRLKPGQAGKERFDNLWLYAYHTGAGINDAMLSGNKSHAIPGFLGASNLTTPSGSPLYGAQFDLGTSGYPWSMEPELGANLYAAWRPASINVGGAPSSYSAFFVNETGLQWTTSATGILDSFGGWYVCNWWHADIDGEVAGPQLFFRVNGFGHFGLETCADVHLIPEYL